MINSTPNFNSFASFTWLCGCEILTMVEILDTALEVMSRQLHSFLATLLTWMGPAEATVTGMYKG